MKKLNEKEIKNEIATFDATVTKNAPEYSEVLSIGIGLEDPESEGGVLYYFDNGEIKIIVDTYEVYPPVYTVEEFIDAYAK